MFEQVTNYYEVLEIQPDASAQDIRNAYFRLKAAYKKDNPALYSVMDASETDDMLSRIEEAFHILSDPETRRDYDERIGIHTSIEDKIVSIDRIPPMESSDEELLVAPTTDFKTTPSTPAFENRLGLQDTGIHVSPFATSAIQKPSSFETRDSFLDRRPRRSIENDTIGPRVTDAVADEIANQTEWRGPFLRRIRELRRCSIDELATQTKISKAYINAIEDEAFEKLPAAVFVRGFIVQIAKFLKLPSDQVAQAYMSRYKR